MTEPLPSPSELLQLFRRRAKKSLGQHFLIDPQVLDAIAFACAASPESTLLEIGPGPGALTQALLRQGNRVIAIEKDRDAVSFLREQFADQPFEVTEGDALKYTIPDDARDWIAVGNLPYNISTQIFFRLIASRAQVARSVFMFQREVARRFVAAPRTKAYGILSLVGRFYYEPEYLMTVPPGAFRPAPKVHSGVVRFERREHLPLPEPMDGDFRKVVKASFAHRRKKLLNNLKGFWQLDRDAVSDILNTLKLPETARAEELDLDTFCALTVALKERAAASTPAPAATPEDEAQ